MIEKNLNFKKDPLVEATDVFSQQWQQFRGHMNPSWYRIVIIAKFQVSVQILLYNKK